MELAPSGTLLPFEVTLDSPSLSVAMKVYDTTSGIAVFLETVPMTHVVNNTYVGFYTFDSERTYLINKQVYEDPGTWAEPNTNYLAGSESFAVSESSVAIYESMMTIAINPNTDTLQILAWLEQSSQLVTNPSQVTVSIYSASGTPLLILGPTSEPSSVGVFQLLYSGASQIFNENFTYVALTQIIQGSNTYSSMRPFTVF